MEVHGVINEQWCKGDLGMKGRGTKKEKKSKP